MNAAEPEPAGIEPVLSPGAIRSMVEGALRFAVVSLGGFAVWAFAGGWFYRNTGEAGLYAACAVVFMGLAGWLLRPLLRSDRTVGRVLGVFVPAFLAYAMVWCGFWFLLRFGAGEWLGSLGGSVVFVGVAGWRLGCRRPGLLVTAALVFFVVHSLGYFAGGWLMQALSGREAGESLRTIAKLSWGVAYGLGFGAGLGFAFHWLQSGQEGRGNQ